MVERKLETLEQKAHKAEQADLGEQQHQAETTLAAQLRQFMSIHSNAQRYVVAVSGGLDSMVLLHLIAQWAKPVVLHINHQLSPHALAWQQQVTQTARDLGLPCVVVPVEVITKGRGLEQAAREARYRVFAEFLQAGDCLLLAHHQDDQAETLLLRLLRGAGLNGLGAMALSRAIGQGQLLRPLLHVPRAEILRYAQAHHLAWVEDESNSSTRFDRNFLRHHILPLLRQRWPQTAAHFSQTAALLQADAALLNHYLTADLAALNPREERWGYSLSLPDLQIKPSHQRNCLLRLWLANLNFATPSLTHLQQINNLLTARVDAEACVVFGNCTIRRYRQRLYAMAPLPSINMDWRKEWSSTATAQLPPGSFLPSKPEDLGLPSGAYQLCFRQGGERCRPLGRQHSQLLKKLLQEYGLAPWLRDRVPLVYRDNEMVAVGDLWLNQAALHHQAI